MSFVIKMKKCEICGKKFKPRGRQKYCSDKCRYKAWRKYLNERYEKKKRSQIQKNNERLEWLKQNKSAIPNHRTKLPSEILKKLIVIAKQQQYPSFYRKKQKCEVCHSTEHLVTHHISYYPPIRITLCAKCHTYLHNNLLVRKRIRPY